MLHSLKFKQTAVSIDGKEYQMEHDTTKLSDESTAGFGNIYVDEKREKELMQFTFFTIQNKIAGYTPMNIKRGVMSAIVEASTGAKLEFSPLLDDTDPFTLKWTLKFQTDPLPFSG